MAIWATQPLDSGFVPSQGKHVNSPSVFQKDPLSFSTGHPQGLKKRREDESWLLLVQDGKENAGPGWGHALLVALKAAITGELKRMITLSW